jgi:hypothetical protein
MVICLCKFIAHLKNVIMKKLFIAALVLSIVACSKDNLTDNNAAITASGRGGGGVEDNQRTPPAAVLSAFTERFGNVPVREWKLRSDGNWRAHFTNNGVLWEATFKADGTLVKSEPA